MSHMSYCRFENTVKDLKDCFDHMGDTSEELSKSEEIARIKIIKLAKNIIENFGYEINVEITDIKDQKIIKKENLL